MQYAPGRQVVINKMLSTIADKILLDVITNSSPQLSPILGKIVLLLPEGRMYQLYVVKNVGEHSSSLQY